MNPEQVGDIVTKNTGVAVLQTMLPHGGGIDIVILAEYRERVLEFLTRWVDACVTEVKLPATENFTENRLFSWMYRWQLRVDADYVVLRFGRPVGLYCQPPQD